MKLTIILQLLVGIQVGFSLIAFDCAHEKADITTISTLTVKPCSESVDNTTSTKENIILLQASETIPIKIYTCYVSVLRHITHCGMHSHSSEVAGGVSNYVYELTENECIEIHKTRQWKINGNLLDNLRLNGTTKSHMTLAGAVNHGGKCEKGTYVDGPNTWYDVLVQAEITITLSDYLADVRLNDNQVILRTGVVCPYTNSRCTDIEHGQVFWDKLTSMECEERDYDVLYQGETTKLTVWENHSGRTRTYYTTTFGDTIFTLESLQETAACHVKGFQTEHPRLIIVPLNRVIVPFRKKRANSRNLDLFTYVNNKFVHVERHIKQEMVKMYKDIMQQKCELSRELLDNQLGLANISPTEFAFRLMKQPGFTAHQAGEVIHIVKCQPVTVSLRETPYCYHEAPVLYNNRSLFMTPKTHLLVSHASELECNPILPVKYHLLDQWYSLTPAVLRTNTPVSLQPNEDQQWKYMDAGNLATAGIYTRDMIDNLRQQIMYPVERQAISNVVSRGLTSHTFDSQGISLTNLMDPLSIEKIITSYWNKAWSCFTWLGDFSAGLLGLYMAGRLVKFVIDTAIHAFSLYPLYGFSWKMLGMFWDAVTYCLLSQGQHKSQNKDKKDPAISEVPLEEVKSGTVEVGTAPLLVPQERQFSKSLYPKMY